MKLKLLKDIRYGLKKFPEGTIGEWVSKGDTFDYYVKFGDFKPLGVFKHEVEIVEEK